MEGHLKVKDVFVRRQLKFFFHFSKQTDILFHWIWILVTENSIEIEDVLKFESLEASKGKKAAFGWLVQP